MKNNKNGMSLIVLVITIIVMIVLAGVVVIGLNSNNPIAKANEASFKSDIGSFKSELMLSLASKKATNADFDYKDVNASNEEIKEYISSMPEKYYEILEIVEGELVFVGTNEEQKEWIEDINVPTLDDKLSESTVTVKLQQEADYPGFMASVDENYIYACTNQVNDVGLGGRKIELFDRNLNKIAYFSDGQFTNDTRFTKLSNGKYAMSTSLMGNNDKYGINHISGKYNTAAIGIVSSTFGGEVAKVVNKTSALYQTGMATYESVDNTFIGLIRNVNNNGGTLSNCAITVGKYDINTMNPIFEEKNIVGKDSNIEPSLEKTFKIGENIYLVVESIARSRMMVLKINSNGDCVEEYELGLPTNTPAYYFTAKAKGNYIYVINSTMWGAFSIARLDVTTGERINIQTAETALYYPKSASVAISDDNEVYIAGNAYESSTAPYVSLGFRYVKIKSDGSFEKYEVVDYTTNKIIITANSISDDKVVLVTRYTEGSDRYFEKRKFELKK